MKKIAAMALVLTMSLSLASCGKASSSAKPAISEDNSEDETVELTLWTYPVGAWGNRTTVSSLLGGFRKAHPNIDISIECVDYTTGDEQVEKAIQNGNAPDLVLESPERAVSGWGERGLLIDLADLWEDGGAEIYDQVRTACQHQNGSYYVFPICMSAHCMAINYELFQKAGALRYIDEETRTWTTEDFIQAVQALRNYGQEQAGVVYCGGQGGDQGTRGLVTGLYGGTFTDSSLTSYTVDSSENIRALQLLRDMDGITFDPALVGSDEISMFCQGELAMAFCWNGSIEVTQTIQNPDLDFDIFPMAFPTPDGQPSLQSGIWGFCIFDNGDEAKTEAAKTFIRYMTENDTQYTQAVQTAHFWPVRDIPNIYANDALMQEYSIFIPYVGDYCQITPHWTQARTAWWKLLQKVGDGEDISDAMKEFTEMVNQTETN